MIEGVPGRQRITVAADKGYDTRVFVAGVCAMHVTPHLAQHTTGRWSAIDARTRRHAGHASVNTSGSSWSKASAG